MCEFLFSYGASTATDARYYGEVFGAFSLGLVPFMLTQLQLRVFYSFHENRTPAIIGVVMLAVGIIGDLVALSVLPGHQVVIGLAAAYGLVTLTGAAISWPLLLRRVGSLDGWRITRSLVRMFLATLPGLAFILATKAVVGSFLNAGPAYGIRHHRDWWWRRAVPVRGLRPAAEGRGVPRLRALPGRPLGRYTAAQSVRDRTPAPLRHASSIFHGDSQQSPNPPRVHNEQETT